MNKRNIQLFKPFYRTNEVLDEIKDCLDLGWTGLGYKTLIFENKWKEYCDYENAHFVNSATSGLHLVINIFKEYYKWKDGDEIITTPLTFVSTNHAILYENLVPVFCDVDKYLCIDPISVKKLINKKTKAVIFMGMGGSIGQYDKILNICKENKLILIVDAAHMAGTRYKSKIIGNDADAVIYSFQAVKNLPTADSGMVCFKEKDFDIIARKKTWLGINKDTFERSKTEGAYKWMYDVEYTGYKYHGNSIMAAIGIVQLKYLDQDNAYRRQIAKWYDESFKHNKKIKLIEIPKDCEPSRHLYQIMIENRDEIILALNRVGIYPGVHYRINTDYDMYKKYKKDCKNAEDYSKKLLSLPMHLEITKEA